MILIGTTVPPWQPEDRATAWLKTKHTGNLKGHELHYFAALEVDGRGLESHKTLLDKLLRADAGGACGVYWTFSLDDRQKYYQTGVRSRRVVIGRNLIIEAALSMNTDYALFLDSDVEPEPDCLAKLLECDTPVVAGDIPAYAFSGGEKDDSYSFPTRIVRWAPAGLLLVRKDALQRVRWGWDPTRNMTDDPFFGEQVRDLLGLCIRLREDAIGRHPPLTP